MKYYVLFFFLFFCVIGKAENDKDRFSIYIDPRDSNQYKIIKIGDTYWMAENLRYNAPNSCYYNNDSVTYLENGRLYHYLSLTNAIPSGWSLPTREDWNKLGKVLSQEHSNVYWKDGDWKNLADYIKKTGIWNDKKTTHDIGFEAIPSGWFFRRSDGNADFVNYGHATIWWADNGWAYTLDYEDNDLRLTYGAKGDNDFSIYSVRCIKRENR